MSSGPDGRRERQGFQMSRGDKGWRNIEGTDEMSLGGFLKSIALVMVIAAGLILMAWYGGLSQRQDTVKVKVGSVAATNSATLAGSNSHSTENSLEARKHDAEIRSDRAARKAIAEFEERFHTDPSYTPQAYAADLRKISNKTGDYSDISDRMQAYIKTQISNSWQFWVTTRSNQVPQLAGQVRGLEMWLVVTASLLAITLLGLVALALIVRKVRLQRTVEWIDHLNKRLQTVEQTSKKYDDKYVDRGSFESMIRYLNDCLHPSGATRGANSFQGIESQDRGRGATGTSARTESVAQQRDEVPDFRMYSTDDLLITGELRAKVAGLPERLISGYYTSQAAKFFDLIADYVKDRSTFDRVQDLREMASKTRIVQPNMAAGNRLDSLVQLLARLQQTVLDDLKENGPPTVDNVKVDDLGRLSRLRQLAEKPQFSEVREYVHGLVELAQEVCDGRADRRDGRRATTLQRVLLMPPPSGSSPMTADQRKFRELCIELQENVKRELVAKTRWRIISPSRGEVFDPHKHESQGFEDTDDVSNAGGNRIAECASAGLEYDGKLELPAQIKIFRYKDKG